MSIYCVDKYIISSILTIFTLRVVMAEKKVAKRKRAAVLFKMVSTEGTGYYYLARRNPKKRPNKMEFMKYDPVAQKHVLFKEEKMSTGGKYGK